MHPYVHCSISHGNQDMETTKASFDICLDKADVVHINNGVLRSHKKIVPFLATWTDPENIMLSEISQTEKVKNHMISLICGI